MPDDTLYGNANAATLASLLAVGQVPRLAAGLVDSTFSLDPDPFAGWPDSGVNGFALTTVSAQVDIRFHADPKARTVYLVIDPATTPLTGTYSLDLGASIASYDATAGAPASVAALLTAWAAVITSTYGPAGSAAQIVQTAEVVTYRQGAVLEDAILLRAIEADPEAYSTFGVLANTVAPALADLYVVREVDSASAQVWLRTSAQLDASVDAPLGMSALVDAWKIPVGGDLGALDSNGYYQRLNVAGCSAAYVQLYDALTPSDTVATTTGVTVVDLALATVYPASWGDE